MSISRKLKNAASGYSDGGSGGVTYIEDAFSTYLYEGTSAIQRIVNGVDLDGEGGLVWTKVRNTSGSHQLTDTESGFRLVSDTTYAGEANQSNVLFNSDGYTVNGSSFFNGGGSDYVSWTFRKAPSFFDVVTYEGDGVSSYREIPHGLGCRAGMVIIKRIDASSDWVVQHIGNNQSAPANKANYVSHLNKTEAKADSGTTINFDESYFNVVGPGMGLADIRCTNLSGAQYVAYVFAHDESDESNIKCGNYTGTGSPQSIDLGFEPQFLLQRWVDGTDSWKMLDNMRGVVAGGYDAQINAESPTAESTAVDRFSFTPTGFEATTTESIAGRKYIYVAIRKPDNP